MLENETPEMGNGTETPAAAQMPTDPADLQAELDRVRKALADANKEAAARRKKLEALEKAEADRQQAQMSELEKAQARVAELEQRAAQAEADRKAALIRAAVIARAQAHGFREPDDALRFLDTSAVEIAEDGQVANVDEVLKKLAKSKPYLLQPTGAVGATNPGRGQGAGETAEQKRARLYGGGDSVIGTTGTGGYVPLREG